MTWQRFTEAQRDGASWLLGVLACGCSALRAGAAATAGNRMTVGHSTLTRPTFWPFHSHRQCLARGPKLSSMPENGR
jgi:hypothetical protein